MTNRQSEILKQIIELYIKTGEPVGSKFLISTYDLKISPATIRNDMATLEKLNMLEKAHTSSGRIPSIEGYKFYAKNQANNENKDLTSKLQDIFAKRRASIEFTLDEAAKAISNIAGLTLVTSSHENNELMKSINLTPINDSMGAVVIVTSTGRVESKVIEFNSLVKLQDIRIAIRLFKERLVDSKLSDLPLKVESLSTILSEQVKNYEAVIQAFVQKVFDFHTKITNKVYGNTSLVKQDEIKREDLAKLMNLISTKSVWDTIESEASDDQNIKIEIRPNNTSLISKKIKTGDITKEISIVGSNRMDYSQAKQAIALLENFFSKKDKGDK